jgi:hypothetical protein
MLQKEDVTITKYMKNYAVFLVTLIFVLVCIVVDQNYLLLLNVICSDNCVDIQSQSHHLQDEMD